MQKTVIAAIAAAIILSSGIFAERAEAVALCGPNGCVKVQTHKIVHHKPGAVAANHI